ncbi:MAG: hypothetical protein HY231_15155 [Acidobacteria bacterium]|nr:hypothetical protein [Acidobacteriota bacterium]
MNTETRTEITIETHEVMVIRHRGKFPKPYCRACGTTAVLLTLDEATVLFPYSTRELCRLVEEEQVHYLETASGSLLICPESLIQWEQATNARHTTLELQSA